MSPSTWTILRTVLSTAAGTVPGIAVGVAWAPPQGVAVGAIGGLAGFLMGLCRLSPKRVFGLTAGMLASYNLGIFGEKILDKVDESTSKEPSRPWEELFTRWLTASGLEHRRGKVVVTGLIGGLVSAIAFVIHDVPSVSNGGEGILLPLPGSRDTLTAQAILACVACSIWGGGLAGFFASAAFRRPLVLGVVFAGFLSVFIDVAARQHSQVSSTAFVVGMTTPAIALALLIGWLCGLSDDPESESV